MTTEREARVRGGKSQGWALAGSVGGRMPGIDPVITGDKKHVIVLFSGQIRVYYVGTKQCISNIPVDDTNGVTDMGLDKEEEIVWISYGNGACKRTEWKTSKIESITLPIPVDKFICILDDRFVVLSHKGGSSRHHDKKGSRNSTTFIANVVLDNGEWKYTILASLGKNCTYFTVSNDQSYYTYYDKQQDKVTVGKFSPDFSGIEQQESVVRQQHHGVSSLAISCQGLAAVGSVTGVIDLYYNILSSSEEQVTIRPLKWHMSNVLALKFSLNDTYLLSGGNEKVLVFWHLDTQSRQFLPRLNGKISSIGGNSNGELYSIRLGDYGEDVSIISAIDLNEVLSISGVKVKFTKLPPSEGNNKKVGDYTCVMGINPKTRQAIIPTNKSQIQTYNIGKDEQVSIQDVAMKIQTGKVFNEEKIVDPEIIEMSISKDGKWLLSVDLTQTPHIDGLLSDLDQEINLKIWKQQQQQQTGMWELSTRIQAPHGPGVKIVASQAAPRGFNNGEAFVTVCNGGGIRLWMPKKQQQQQQEIWTVRKVIKPFNTTSPSAVAIAWSSDGSLIILGFETSLYIIDGMRFEMVGILPNILLSRIRSLEILAGGKLVCVSKTQICVMDLITNSMDWSIGVASVPPGGKRLFASDGNETFAVGINSVLNKHAMIGQVMIFQTSSPIPIYIHSHPAPIGSVVNDPGTNDYVFVDTQSRLNVLTSSGAQQQQRRPPPQGVVGDVGVGLAITYASSPPQQQRQTTKPTQTGTKTVVVEMDQVFNGPEYAMGSLDEYFDKVLRVMNDA